MTFPRIFVRFKYWREFPPTHVLVRSLAIGIGTYKPETRRTAAEVEQSDADFAAMFPGGVISS